MALPEQAEGPLHPPSPAGCTHPSGDRASLGSGQSRAGAALAEPGTTQIPWQHWQLGWSVPQSWGQTHLRLCLGITHHTDKSMAWTGTSFLILSTRLAKISSILQLAAQTHCETPGTPNCCQLPKHSEVLRPSSAISPSTPPPWTCIQLQKCQPQEEAGKLQRDLPCLRWDQFPQQHPLGKHHTGNKREQPFPSLPGLGLSSPHLQCWSCSVTSTSPSGQHKVPNLDFCLPTAKQTHPGTLNNSSCLEQNTSRIIAVPPKIHFCPPSISIQLKK